MEGNCVHKRCREKYTNKKAVNSRINAQDNENSPQKRPRLRKRSLPGEAKTNEPVCLFCGIGRREFKRVGKKNNVGELSAVQTKTLFQNSVVKHCQERGDSWANEVSAKIDYLQDLRAADVVYHSVCYSNFRSGFSKPKVFQSADETPRKKAKLGGRPENPNSIAAFIHVVDFVETMDYDNVTLYDLQKIMMGKLEELKVAEPLSDVFSIKHIKRKLKQHFGKDKIIFSESAGKPDVVTLKRTASTILRDFNSQPRNENIEDEKMRTIKAAAAFLRADIKSLSSEMDKYPDVASIENAHEFVPPALEAFLEGLVKGKDVKIKTTAICQAIVQSTRPYTICWFCCCTM